MVLGKKKGAVTYAVDQRRVKWGQENGQKLLIPVGNKASEEDGDFDVMGKKLKWMMEKHAFFTAMLSHEEDRIKV